MLYCGRRGQAATELAVLGSLVLIIFSFLINYSERLNRKQSYIQQTFRAALKEARSANSSASFTKVAFRRMPNAYSPYELGQLDSFSSSASVYWSDGTGSDPVSKYQLNEDSPIAYTAREDITAGTTETSTNEFTNDVRSIVSTLRTASPGTGVVTTKTLQATDTLTADVTIDGTEYHFDHELDAGGKYSSSGSGIARSVTLR